MTTEHQDVKQNEDDPLRDYWKPEITAQKLEMCARQLRRLDAAGIGPPKTIIGPKKIYYRKQAVLEWLASREQKPRKRH